MTLPQVLVVLILANALGSVLSCGGGGGPSPCSWSTCRSEWRNDWSPGISTGRCVNQRRNAHHIYTSHSGSGSCPASTNCSPQSQSRTMCKCYIGLPDAHVVNVKCNLLRILHYEMQFFTLIRCQKGGPLKLLLYFGERCA